MRKFNKQSLLAVSLVSMLLPISVVQGQQVDYSSEEAILSYGTGYGFSRAIQQELANSFPNADIDALLEGITDFLKGRQSKFTSEEFQTAAAKVEERMAQDEEVQMMADYQAISDFRAVEGVQESESGILYQVISEGAGEIPNKEDTVVVHYKGSLVNGNVFDSSYARGEPLAFALNSVIPGWVEVLQMMPVGSHWKVMIPPDLAYGQRGAPPAIPPSATLVFEIELIDIQ